MRTYEEQLDQSFEDFLHEVDAYFLETGKLHSTLANLIRRLEEATIPYAVLGAIALGRHGHRRMTTGIDLLLSPEGLAQFRERYLGRAYLLAFPGAGKSFRATDTGVRVDVIQATVCPSRWCSQARPKFPSRWRESVWCPSKSSSSLSSPPA